jgi:hypothetical protein
MEIWKDIPEYEGYQVSNLGNVRSCKSGNWIIMNPQKTIKGYLTVHLSLGKRGNSKTIFVHKLVSIAFLNHIPKGMLEVIDHINGIKTDNRLENIRLVTTRDNNIYKSLSMNTSSKYVGVDFRKSRNKFRACITINNKTKYLGQFKCELPAAAAYNKALKELNKQKI